MDEKDRESIYHCRKALERAIANLEGSEICRENKDAIQKFAIDSLAQGRAPSNVTKYVLQLKVCARILGKPFSESCREDVVRVVGILENSGYTRHTRRTMKSSLKVFYKWLRASGEFPDEVRWIRPGKARNSIAPGDLLTKDEVSRIIDAALNLRDKALVSVLYESALRPQEILPVRIKQVRFDDYGTLLTVDGKIGVQRTVRLLASTSLLSAWLNVHPRKSDPEAPLFPNFDNKNPFRFLTYASFRKILKTAVDKAGIRRKIYPYLFRHSRLTELARTGFTGYQFNLFAGWTLDSNMASTYIHLLSEDVDDAILKLNGIVKEETHQAEFKPVICPRCSKSNAPGVKLCLICGFALDLKASYEIEKKDERIEQLARALAAAINDEDKLDSLIRAVLGKGVSSRV